MNIDNKTAGYGFILISLVFLTQAVITNIIISDLSDKIDRNDEVVSNLTSEIDQVRAEYYANTYLLWTADLDPVIAGEMYADLPIAFSYSCFLESDFLEISPGYLLKYRFADDKHILVSDIDLVCFEGIELVECQKVCG